VYGSQQDNTTVSIPSRTDGGGITIADWYSVAGGESGYMAPDPKNPEVTYGGSYFGAMTRFDHKSGQARNITVWPDYPGGRTAADMKYRFQWTYPIVIPPLEPNAVYAGANVLFKSTNQGQSWDPVSPDLTRNDKDKENGGRLEEFYSTIFAIAASRVDKNVMWTGSDDGLVYLTTDGTKSWKKVTPPELPEWSRINNIEASPFSAGTAYVAANRYQLDDERPLLYKTSDFGKTWKLIVHGIPDHFFTRSVREDPSRKGLLYAATESGVFVSFDDGENWQSLQLNLPIVPVTDLTIKNDDLVASTQGRAFWILDDLTVLHQLAKVTQPTTLFKPRDVYRPSRRGIRIGGPVGQNPATDAVIHYYFTSKPASVKLEILDKTGAVIRTFGKIPGNAGMNQFEWDLRYPEAHGLEGEVTHLAGGSLRGPMAVPGTYRVKLTSDAGTQEQSFAVLKDPRIATTDADYTEQFEFETSVRNKLSETDDAINQIHKVLARLKGSPTAAAIEKQFDELLRDLYEPKYTGYDDQMLVFPLELNNRIAALANYAEGAYAPTDQERKVFNELSADLEGLTSKMKHLMASPGVGAK
jgi:hypothetical protein